MSEYSEDYEQEPEYVTKEIIEKMINLDLIDVTQARQMEQLTPLGDANATNV